VSLCLPLSLRPPVSLCLLSLRWPCRC